MAEKFPYRVVELWVGRGNASEVILMPFKETGELHETTELLVCLLAVIWIGCFPSSWESLFFLFEGCCRWRLLILFCWSNLSLLITVIDHLVSSVFGFVFCEYCIWETEVMEKKSNLPGITQQVTDRARNWARVPGCFHRAEMASSVAFKQGSDWIWLSKVICFQLSAFLPFSWEICFLNAAFPPVSFGMLVAWCVAGAWHRRCSALISTIVRSAFVYN